MRDNQFDKELAHNHTLGTVLKQAGYATAAIGKWGLQGGSGFPSHPQNRGFDYFYGSVRSDTPPYLPGFGQVSVPLPGTSADCGFIRLRVTGP